MGSSVVDVGPRLVVVLVVLTALAAVAGRLSGLGQDRPIVTAALRATVQLAAVSAVLLVVVRSLLLSALFVLLMLTVATATSAGRITGRAAARAPRPARRPPRCPSSAAPPRSSPWCWPAARSRCAAAVIPIAGILIGGAMTATSLAGRRLRDELHSRRGEVEAALALGFLPRDAVLVIGGPVGGHRAGPGLDQTRTVGLVTLPGAFVGVLLGGGSPLQAGAAQLLVLSACSPPRCSRSGRSPS